MHHPALLSFIAILTLNLSKSLAFLQVLQIFISKFLKEEDVDTPSDVTKITINTKTAFHLRPLGLEMTYYLI
jgi:hypothetical protein